MKKILLSAMACGLLLTACDETAPPPDQKRPSGSVSVLGYDAELVKAKVSLYAVDDNLRKIGSPLFTGVTDDYGRVVAEELNIPDQYLLAEVGAQGHYFEESTGAKIELEPSDVLTSIQYYKAGDALQFTASGFTHIATAYAQCLVSQYGENANNALVEATSAFGAYSSVDVFRTDPVNPSLLKANGLSLDKPVAYGFLHAGVSKFMELEAIAQSQEPFSLNYRSIDFYRFAAKDISQDKNCALDGAIQDADGQRITIGLGNYEFAESTYRVKLARSVLEFSRSDANKTSVTDVDLLPMANALSLAESARLFNGVDPIALDDEGPTVDLPYSEDQYFGGIINYAFTLEDYSGVREVELFIDGESVGKRLQTNEPVFQSINTAFYPDGAHVIKILATDNQYVQSETIHNVIFWNASPIIELASEKRTQDLTYNIELNLTSPIEVTTATVKGAIVEVVDNTVSATIALSPGINSVPVTATNALGGKSETFIDIYVDRVAPTLTLLDPRSSYFVHYSPDENVNNSYLSPLDFSGNAADPLYMSDNTVALNGQAVTDDNLRNGKFAYIQFSVKDDLGVQPVEVITPSSEIKVTYSYFVNDEPVFEGRDLVSNGSGSAASDYRLPFTEEYLGDNWFLTNANDKHEVVVTLRDIPGNTAEFGYKFKTRYFPGNPLFEFTVLEGRYNNFSMIERPSVGNQESIYTYEFTNNYDFDVLFTVSSIPDDRVLLNWQQGYRVAKVTETEQSYAKVECEAPVVGETNPWVGGFNAGDKVLISTDSSYSYTVTKRTERMSSDPVVTRDIQYASIAHYPRQIYTDTLPPTEYFNVYDAATLDGYPVLWIVLNRSVIDDNGDGYPDNDKDRITVALFPTVLKLEGQPACPLDSRTVVMDVPRGYVPTQSDFDYKPFATFLIGDSFIDFTRVTTFTYRPGYPEDVITNKLDGYTTSNVIKYYVEDNIVEPVDGHIRVPAGSELKMKVISEFPETTSHGMECNFGYDENDQASCDTYFKILTSSKMDYTISTINPDGLPLENSDYSIDSGDVQSIID